MACRFWSWILPLIWLVEVVGGEGFVEMFRDGRCQQSQGSFALVNEGLDGKCVDLTTVSEVGYESFMLLGLEDGFTGLFFSNFLFFALLVQPFPCPWPLISTFPTF